MHPVFHGFWAFLGLYRVCTAILLASRANGVIDGAGQHPNSWRLVSDGIPWFVLGLYVRNRRDSPRLTEIVKKCNKSN
jgi:hypothetical protein